MPALTPEQISTYNDTGYLVLPDLLNESDMAPVREALTQKVDMIAEELLAAGLINDPLPDESFPNRLARLFDGLTAADFLRFGRSWRDRIPGYFTLMSNPKIVDAIESLLGPEIFSNPVYNVRPKIPRVAAGAVPWHQDKSYWPEANSNPVITVWIPFVDSTLENGCLHIIPRTQRTRVMGYHADTYTGTGYTELDDEQLKALLGTDKAVSLPVRAGTAILFNDRLVHSSTPNNSEHVRWSVDLRYQPTDQDPMPEQGVGFLARSRAHPQRVAGLADWLANRPEAAAR
jgi:ectoine hydroxylase-related dioxygenase (phytanoyl-CoA dioxygenase family)